MRRRLKVQVEEMKIWSEPLRVRVGHDGKN
jgi:hypothetical protein